MATWFNCKISLISKNECWYFLIEKNCSTFVGELYHTCGQIIAQLWADYKTLVGVAFLVNLHPVLCLWCASLLWQKYNYVHGFVITIKIISDVYNPQIFEKLPHVHSLKVIYILYCFDTIIMAYILSLH